MAGQELSRAHTAPTRRSVVRAAAWSVPAISIAAAAPAFAGSGAVAPGDQTAVSFTSALFWRPTSAEISAFGENAFYWGLIPETTILWVTELTNTGPATGTVNLALGVPLGTAAKKEFQILDAGGLTTVPAVNALTPRSAAGVGITVPPLAAGASAALTVAIGAPSTISRGTTASWDLTVTPPDRGTTKSVPVTSYTAFRNSL